MRCIEDGGIVGGRQEKQFLYCTLMDYLSAGQADHRMLLGNFSRARREGTSGSARRYETAAQRVIE